MRKIESIQGLKGIAALMVFFSHALCMPITPFYGLRDTPWHFFYDGQIAVMLFIVISGFFYFKPSKPTIESYLGGVKKKILRIFPAYIISMIIGFVCCNLNLDYNANFFTDWSNQFWRESVGFNELCKQLTVLWPHNPDLINPPSWYIGMEVRLFLVIPLIIMLCNIKYLKWYILIPLSLLIFYGDSNYYSACLCGCLTKIAYDKILKNQDLKSKRIKYIFLCAIVVAVFFLNVRNQFDINKTISFAFQTIGACIVVLAVSLFNFKFLTNKVLLWLGSISYEFYLCHFSILLLAKCFYHDPITYVGLCLALSLLLSIGINKLCKLFISKISSNG